MKISKVAVIGAGSWGSVLANVLVKNGLDVKIWTREEKQVAELNQQHTNRHYLPELKYDERLIATNDLAAAIKDRQVILLVIPTVAIRTVSQKLVKFCKKTMSNH